MFQNIPNLQGVKSETDGDGNTLYYIPEPFTYSIDFNNLTGAWSQASGQIQIEADSAFVIKAQVVTCENVDTEITPDPSLPAIKVMLTDGGSTRKLMNQPAYVASLFGDARLPFILPTEKFLSPSSNLQVQITSPVSFAKTYNLQLSFVGEKRYYLSKR